MQLRLPPSTSITNLIRIHRCGIRPSAFSTPLYRSAFASSGRRALKQNSHTRTRATPLPSGVGLTALGITLVVAAAGAFASLYNLTDLGTSFSTGEKERTDEPIRRANMPINRIPGDEILPGRPGNLTPEQEHKLRELWYEMGKLTDTLPSRESMEAAGWPVPSSPGTSIVDDGSSIAAKKKKSRFGLGKSKKDTEMSAADAALDKHGAKKEFKEALTNMTQKELRDALWDFSKCDDPDANLCRYLRARKWDVQAALVMLVSTIYWRQRVMDLDYNVMLNGEECAMRAERGELTGTGGISKQLGYDMLQQMRMGKSYLHGVDKSGRPICYVKVRLHKGGQFSQESIERLTVFVIETARFMLKPPYLETALIVFDMTGFSLANMDYTPVKFMIKVFEANYPESLGVVLVHNAPWVFSSIWAVIRGWLDPVVASKIHFTKGVGEMSKYIDVENIPEELGGNEDWAWEYPAPIEGENDIMRDTATRDKLLDVRKGLLDEYEAATMDWVLTNGVNDEEPSARRAAIAKKLHSNYWQLDPYVRARSMYDRIGVIRANGVIEPYSDEYGYTSSSAGKPYVNGTGGGNLYSSWQRRSIDAQSVDSVYYDAES